MAANPTAIVNEAKALILEYAQQHRDGLITHDELEGKIHLTLQWLLKEMLKCCLDPRRAPDGRHGRRYADADL